MHSYDITPEAEYKSSSSEMTEAAIAAVCGGISNPDNAYVRPEVEPATAELAAKARDCRGSRA
jgi:hypothetical protein